MKGIWILPTRRRLVKLQNFFNKAVENGMTTPGVAVVQRDELAELSDGYAALNIPKNWKIVASNSEGLGPKCQELWPAYKNLDWVGLGCDDLSPQTKNWDAILLSHVNGRNIVSCDDGQQHAARMSGITIFSGGLLRAMGYLFPPGFWHTFADNVWEDLGREANCWTYVDSVLVKHDHPFVDQKIDPKLADETTYKSYGQSERDLTAYRDWMKNEKSAVVQRIKELESANG